MSKISLKGVNTKEISSLFKRSASLENLIFITVRGNEFESTSYNKNKSALKSVSADLEKVCDTFVNENGNDPVKIQFSNANKLIQHLALVGSENVDIVFDIEDNGYCKKVDIRNDEVKFSLACADKEAVNFLEIPDSAKFSIFEDSSKLVFKMNINDSEFKYVNSLLNLNKESTRVFFNFTGDDVFISEIEATDDNVRTIVNEIIQSGDNSRFDAFDKLYSKKMNISDLEVSDNFESAYIGCFNKQYFPLIDADKYYTVEFHTNKIRFISYDDEEFAKTYVVLTPVRFV